MSKKEKKMPIKRYYDDFISLSTEIGDDSVDSFDSLYEVDAINSGCSYNAISPSLSRSVYNDSGLANVLTISCDYKRKLYPLVDPQKRAECYKHFLCYDPDFLMANDPALSLFLHERKAALYICRECIKQADKFEALASNRKDCYRICEWEFLTTDSSTTPLIRHIDYHKKEYFKNLLKILPLFLIVAFNQENIVHEID